MRGPFPDDYQLQQMEKLQNYVEGLSQEQKKLISCGPDRESDFYKKHIEPLEKRREAQEGERRAVKRAKRRAALWRAVKWAGTFIAGIIATLIAQWVAYSLGWL